MQDHLKVISLQGAAVTRYVQHFVQQNCRAAADTIPQATYFRLILLAFLMI